MTSLVSGWHGLCCSLLSDPESLENIVLLGIILSCTHHTCTSMAIEEFFAYTACNVLFIARLVFICSRFVLPCDFLLPC